MAVCTLMNIQLKPEDRMLPSQMWPDFDAEPEEIRLEDSQEMLRQGINYLKDL